MCGIAGWIDWQADLSQERPMIERMAQTICHRGPDAQGSWVSSRAALAHHRLFVIDPHGGKQPMSYEDTQQAYALTYNGEIYNFREIRSELESRGHSFHTHSDTEVLLHSYLEWQEDCVNHFNGIFAFGLWDGKKQQLLMARDHLGVKPLFYAQRGSAIIFGSELKVLLAHPLVKAEIDNHGLADVLGFRRSLGSGVFRDIHELRPGHFAVFTRERTVISRYWSLRSAPHTDNLATTTEKIRALLEDTVRHQLIADVPISAMLSGGLDSSALTALVAQNFHKEGRDLHTYSINYEGSDEHFEANALRPSLDAPWVDRVSEHTHSIHHNVMVKTSDLIENVLLPMRMHDLPANGQLETSLYLLCRAMRQDSVVAISGESADEVFGGYPWFHNPEALNAPTFPWLAMLGQNNNQVLSWLSPDVLARVNPLEHLQKIYTDGLAEVPRLPGESPEDARIREVFYFNLMHFLPMLLDRKDRMSMAVGFEVRVPFCDYRLVEYAWNIPWKMKNTDNIEKGILRAAISDLLPDDVRMRRKSAYPSSQNPTYQEALRQMVVEIINQPGSPILPLLNLHVIKAIIKPEVSLPGEAGNFLFERIIQMNAWLQEYQIAII